MCIRLVALRRKLTRLIVTEMLLAILSICSEEELVESDTDTEDDAETKTLADAVAGNAEYTARKQQIKNKIMAVGRMQRVFQLLRYVILTIDSLIH